MDLTGDGARVVSGAQDGTITLWRDSTEEETEASRADEERNIMLTQDLMNLVAQKKYAKAAALALELKQPFRLLQIVEMIMLKPDFSKDPNGMGGVFDFDKFGR